MWMWSVSNLYQLLFYSFVEFFVDHQQLHSIHIPVIDIEHTAIDRTIDCRIRWVVHIASFTFSGSTFPDFKVNKFDIVVAMVIVVVVVTQYGSAGCGAFV